MFHSSNTEQIIDPFIIANIKMNNSESEVIEIFDTPSFYMLIPIVIATVVGFIGNVLILTVILGSKTFRRKTNYLIANLAIGSLVHVVFGTFATTYRMHIKEWKYGLEACQVYCFLKRLPVAILSFTCLAMTIDRNRIVRNPLVPRSARYICTQIIGIWTLSSLIMVPLGFTGDIEERITSEKSNLVLAVHCIEQKWTVGMNQIIYSVLFLLTIHLIPIVVMVIGLLKMQNKIQFLLKTQSQNKGLFLQDRRIGIIRNNCAFTGIFILCWLPTGILRFPIDLPKEFLPVEIRQHFMYYSDLTIILGYVHTCITPLVLYSLSHDLRDHLKMILYFCCPQRFNKVDSHVEGRYDFCEFCIRDDGGSSGSCPLDQNDNDDGDDEKNKVSLQRLPFPIPKLFVSMEDKDEITELGENEF